MDINIKEKYIEAQAKITETTNNIKYKKRKKIIKIFSFFIIFIITSLAVFSSQVMVSQQSSASWFSQLPIIRQIKHLAESADRQLKGEIDNRINILLLGMGGRQHEGGYLTDTLILASIEPSTKKVSLVSIPRDMAIPIENMGWKKINSVNAFAEIDKEDSGGLAISQTVSDILNIPIDYYVRVDFEGFINIVDELGGISVNVENVINDQQYPVRGMEQAENYASRFEHLYIESGWQKMDGELALKYVRSRHSLGAEGSDFARAKRQQKVIEAVKENVLSLKTIFKPKMITGIINQLNEHISTNLKIWEMVKLWEIEKDIEQKDIINKVLDNSPNGLLVETYSSDGAYILVPKSGDFSEIEYFVNNIFSDAPTRDKAKSLSVLKSRIDANVSFGLPDWLVEDIKKDIQGEKKPVQPDFVIIIGQNADSTKSGTPNPANLAE